MATHSSILAWRIPWREESDGLQSMALQRFGHNWVTNTFTFTYSYYKISATSPYYTICPWAHLTSKICTYHLPTPVLPLFPAAYHWFVLCSPLAPVVKNLPAVQETQEMRVWSLDWEYSREEERATHSSILAWKTPWTEEPRGLQYVGSQRVGCSWVSMHDVWVKTTTCSSQLGFSDIPGASPTIPT